MASRSGEADTSMEQDTLDALRRIAEALERLAPRANAEPDLSGEDCFVFAPPAGLTPVPRVNRVAVELLRGIDRARDILLENTLTYNGIHIHINQ